MLETPRCPEGNGGTSQRGDADRQKRRKSEPIDHEVGNDLQRDDPRANTWAISSTAQETKAGKRQRQTCRYRVSRGQVRDGRMLEDHEIDLAEVSPDAPPDAICRVGSDDSHGGHEEHREQAGDAIQPEYRDRSGELLKEEAVAPSMMR